MKFLIFPLLLLSSLVLHGQTPATQVNVESRVLEVNKDWMKELGITFGGGLATGTIGDLGDYAWGSFFEVGVEAEPLNNLFVNPSLLILPFLNKFSVKERINNIAFAVPVKIAGDNKPVTAGIGVGPIVTYAINQVVFFEDGNETFNLPESVNTLNIGIQVLPEIRIRNTVTDVIVQGGATMMLGGLFESQSRPQSTGSVPFLAHIGIIGKFFGNRNHQRERDNLLIFIKPDIVDPSEE